jgi:hypothetical protein
MTLTVHLVALSCPAKAGHPVVPVPSVKLCCAQIAVAWLLDRPVEPGDDGNGIQALETEHQRTALVTAGARLGSNVNVADQTFVA